MKPKFHQVPKQSDNTFRIRHDVLPNFGTAWHYHPEIELHYVIKGYGVKFIGDNISNFHEGEMILLGSNIPHTWKCTIPQDAKSYVEALVLHFHPESLGREFLYLPETIDFVKVLNSSRNGLYIYGETKSLIKNLMIQMSEASRLRKIIFLLEIFDILAHSTDYKQISQNQSSLRLDSTDDERMNNIFNYTLKNLRNKIYLEDVADIANLSVTSFCRYFKNITNKSYYNFLIELRLSHACRLLFNSNHTIKQIVEESGFENMSNFYRHFKVFKNCTPKEYRQRFKLNKIV